MFYLLIYSITALFIIGLSITSFGPALLQIAENVKLPLSEINSILLFKPIGALIGIITMSYLQNRFNPKLLLSIYISFIAVGSIALPFTTTLGQVMVVILISAIGEGGLDLGINTLFLRQYKKMNHFPILHGMFGLGATIIPSVIGFEIDLRNSILISFISIGVLAILLILLTIPLKITKYNNLPDNITPTPEVKQRKFLNYPNLVLALFAFIVLVYVGTEVIFSVWTFNFFELARNYSASQAGILTSLLLLSFTLFRILGALVSSKHLFKFLILNGLLIFAGGTILLIFNSAIPDYFGVVLIGAGLSTVFPFVTLYYAKITRLKNSGIALFFAVGGLGAMLFPWLTGILIQIDLNYIFYVSFALNSVYIIVLVVVGLIYRARSKKQGGQNELS